MNLLFFAFPRKFPFERFTTWMFGQPVVHANLPHEDLLLLKGGWGKVRNLMRQELDFVYNQLHDYLIRQSRDWLICWLESGDKLFHSWRNDFISYPNLKASTFGNLLRLQLNLTPREDPLLTIREFYVI